MKGKRKGGCECGAVRYQVEGEPKAVVVCHCRNCQRQSGGAFGMSMVFAADQFMCESGELASFERPTKSGATMQGRFCPECGTRIYNQKAGAPVIILKPGTLDDTSELRPTLQLWTSRKQSWFDLPQLQGFEEQPS
jgi:hypothetical protein